MLSVLRSAPPQQSPVEPQRVKFTPPFGLGGTRKDPARKSPTTADGRARHSFTRQSVDIVTGYSAKRRQRRVCSVLPIRSLFDNRPEARLERPHTPTSSFTMPGRNIVASQPMSGRRTRLEDGPWAISAAETPHDPSSYSLYIKSECLVVASVSTLHIIGVALFDSPRPGSRRRPSLVLLCSGAVS